ncbi:MAG: UDP-glucose 4-epimerase [Actinomycetota bacterium]|jgi:UDP-glucose 4-epimerase|nr:UDP-glucose 4-epimerase [Actinomycetota bacterium]
MKPETVLVTGGAGFIGSHTCVELLEAGNDVVVIDDYSNSHPSALDRVREITGKSFAVYEVDLRDRAGLSAVFEAHPIDSVIHFAAKKAVGESTQIPLEYFDINIGGTTNLIRTMHQHEVTRLVFSSSCSIYGDSSAAPLSEADPANPTNPYALSKWMCEQVLSQACVYIPELSVIALRYFNPIGAHPTGRLGEDPLGVPNNVMPYLSQIAVGRLTELSVFGDDYPTPDGTAIRDYIHVVDVADAHRVALEHLDDRDGFRVFNLGTGSGVSVLELVAAFSKACGKEIPHRIAGRRLGDVASLIADAANIDREWGWRTRRDLADMCRDAWNFQRQNPEGYPV